MRNAVRLLSSPAVASVLAALALPALPTPTAAQSREVRVLIAPLLVPDGVDRRFGERVADEVRKAIESFAGWVAIEEREVNTTLQRLNLEAEEMTRIQWQQLASRMSAGMVMLGSAAVVAGGVEVEVEFQDPDTGDGLPVPKFTVASDREHREAAQRIVASLERGVTYTQLLLWCSEYLMSEALDDAMRNCANALEINPNGIRAIYLRARTYMAMEDWNAAVPDLERVVQENPSNTEALESLAYTHAQLGNRDRSNELYREYLEFNPDDPGIRLNVAYELVRAGAFGEAMAILQEGVERDPENPALLEYLGQVALSAGTQGGEVVDAAAIRVAVHAFDRLLTIEGDRINPAILSNVINAKVLLGEHQDALDFSERAIGLIESRPAPDEEAAGAGRGEGPPRTSREELLAQVHAARAGVYSRTQRYGHAASALQTAVTLDPSLPDAHRRLAILKLKAGDSEGAVADFRIAVARGTDPDTIAQAIFGQAYNDHFAGQFRRPPTAIDMGELGRAIVLFEIAAEFATTDAVAQRVHFYLAYGHYLRGNAADARNEEDEACAPARRALDAFRNVGPHLRRAGSYEATVQSQLRDVLDRQLYRQEQIIKAACS